jgi:hypothetical protein
MPWNDAKGPTDKESAVAYSQEFLNEIYLPRLLSSKYDGQTACSFVLLSLSIKYIIHY